MAAKEELTSSFRRLARNLNELEINTIVVSDQGMTGRPMADERHALYDIARCYGAWIEAVRSRYDFGAGSDPWEHGPDASPGLRGSRVSFEQLDRSANQLLAGIATLTVDEQTVLARIKKNSGWLASTLARKGVDNHLSRAEINGQPGQQPIGLEAHERAHLRKMWEIGSQIIAMQTTVTISGDVVTKVQRGYDTTAHEKLHGLHGDGVRIATQTWGALVSAAGQVVRAIFDRS